MPGASAYESASTGPDGDGAAPHVVVNVSAAVPAAVAIPVNSSIFSRVEDVMNEPLEGAALPEAGTTARERVRTMSNAQISVLIRHLEAKVVAIGGRHGELSNGLWMGSNSGLLSMAVEEQRLRKAAYDAEHKEEVTKVNRAEAKREKRKADAVSRRMVLSATAALTRKRAEAQVRLAEDEKIMLDKATYSSRARKTGEARFVSMCGVVVCVVVAIWALDEVIDEVSKSREGALTLVPLVVVAFAGALAFAVYGCVRGSLTWRYHRSEEGVLEEIDERSETLMRKWELDQRRKERLEQQARHDARVKKKTEHKVSNAAAKMRTMNMLRQFGKSTGGMPGALGAAAKARMAQLASSGMARVSGEEAAEDAARDETDDSRERWVETEFPPPTDAELVGGKPNRLRIGLVRLRPVRAGGGGGRLPLGGAGTQRPEGPAATTSEGKKKSKRKQRSDAAARKAAAATAAAAAAQEEGAVRSVARIWRSERTTTAAATLADGSAEWRQVIDLPVDERAETALALDVQRRVVASAGASSWAPCGSLALDVRELKLAQRSGAAYRGWHALAPAEEAPSHEVELVLSWTYSAANDRPPNELVVDVVDADGLLPADITGKSDPYVTLTSGTHSAKTKVVKQTLAPKWGERLVLVADDPRAPLEVVVTDWDLIGSDDFLGRVEMRLASLKNVQPAPIKYHLEGQRRNRSEKDPKRGKRGTLTLGVRWWYNPDTDHFAEADGHESTPPNELRVTLTKAWGLTAADISGKSDPFARLTLGGRKEKSSTQSQTLEPVWNDRFVFPLDDWTRRLDVKVEDWDALGADDWLGSVSIKLDEKAALREKAVIRHAHRLSRPDDEKIKASLTGMQNKSEDIGRVELTMRWIYNLETDHFFEVKEYKRREPNELRIKLCRARGLRAMDYNPFGEGMSDPYASLSMGGFFKQDESGAYKRDHETGGKLSLVSTTKKATLAPEWDETFVLKAADITERLEVLLEDWDRIGKNDFLGYAKVGLWDRQLSRKKRVRKWYKLTGPPGGSGSGSGPYGEVEIDLRWVTAEAGALEEDAAADQQEAAEAEQVAAKERDRARRHSKANARPMNKAEKRAARKVELAAEEAAAKHQVGEQAPGNSAVLVVEDLDGEVAEQAG